jgi:septin family protein
VNVIPVIAKADSFKTKELFKMKLDIINTAIDRGVKFFDCDKAIDSVAKNVRVAQFFIKDYL